MNKIFTGCLIMLMLLSVGFAEHVSVIISEQTVNEFITAVGPVTGKGKKKGVKYNWKVKKAKFDFEPGSATFLATVNLDAGFFKFSDKVTSKVNVKYDVKTNNIRMEVEKAIFKIYIKVLGSKIKVGEVDIAKYYKPKFEFKGPQPIQKKVEVSVSAKKTRIITATMTRQELVIEKDRIRVSSDLTYSGADKQ